MLIQNKTLNWREKNINLGANITVLYPVTSKVIQVDPMNHKKNGFISCYQYSYLKRAFFDNILKVVVIFESKNWIGFYLKVPSNVGVFLYNFPKNLFNTHLHR